MIIDREAPQETIYSPLVPSYEAAKAPSEEAAAIMSEPEPVDWKKEPLPTKYLVLGGSFCGDLSHYVFELFLPFQIEQRRAGAQRARL